MSPDKGLLKQALMVSCGLRNQKSANHGFIVLQTRRSMGGNISGWYFKKLELIVLLISKLQLML